MLESIALDSSSLRRRWYSLFWRCRLWAFDSSNSSKKSSMRTVSSSSFCAGDRSDSHSIFNSRALARMNSMRRATAIPRDAHRPHCFRDLGPDLVSPGARLRTSGCWRATAPDGFRLRVGVYLAKWDSGSVSCNQVLGLVCPVRIYRFFSWITVPRNGSGRYRTTGGRHVSCSVEARPQPLNVDYIRYFFVLAQLSTYEGYDTCSFDFLREPSDQDMI